jgi:hypothetical protein
MNYYQNTDTGVLWTEDDIHSAFKGEIPSHWRPVDIVPQGEDHKPNPFVQLFAMAVYIAFGTALLSFAIGLAFFAVKFAARAVAA